MNWKSAIPLILAVVLGLAAAKLGRDVLLRGRGRSAEGTKLAKIVVAKGDLDVGRTLEEGDLVVGQISAETSPSNGYKEAAELAGRVLIVPAVKGQPVLESMLAPRGSGQGPQALVPPGMRAVSVEVNEVSGLAGLIVPGCPVDVVTTLRDESVKEAVSRTIVENVKVLAVGQRFSAGVAEPAKKGEEANAIAKSVTLLVSPREAEAIELASTSGKMRLLLRSPLDSARTRSEGMTVMKLIGREGAERWDRWVRALSNVQSTQVPQGVQAAAVKPVESGGPTTRPSEQRFVEVIRNGVVTRVAVDGAVAAPVQSRETVTNTDMAPVTPGRVP